MEELAKQYGGVILTTIVFVALAMLIVWLCSANNNSFVAQQFQTALQGFFTRMNSTIPTP